MQCKILFFQLIIHKTFIIAQNLYAAFVLSNAENLYVIFILQLNYSFLDKLTVSTVNLKIAKNVSGIDRAESNWYYGLNIRMNSLKCSIFKIII